jgi:thiamine kinase-like enzyme
MFTIRKKLVALPFFKQIKEIQELEKGASHHCFKVITGNGNYFAKYFESDRATRENEHKVTVVAAKAGITPRILHCSTHWLITDFIEGQLTDEQTTDKKIIIATGLIKKCHQLKIDLTPLDLHAILDYLTKYQDFRFEQLNVIRSIIKKLPKIQEVQSLVVCHGDVNFSNILFTKNPYLIDFEYACLAEPEYDLAMMIAINLLNVQQQQLLLSRYEEISPGKLCYENLKSYLSYCYLINGLWCLLKPTKVCSEEIVELAVKQFTALADLTGYNALAIVK